MHFLKPFKDCSEALSADAQPTMHTFCLWSEKLLKVCATEMLDSEIIMRLKNNTLNSLNKRFAPSTAYYVGLFLNPPFKEMRFLSPKLKENVMVTVKAMLSEMINDEEASNEFVELRTASPDEKGSGLFAEFQDKKFSKKPKLQLNSFDIEIEKYLNGCAAISDQNVLEFWKCSDLKLMKRLARYILAIPASSATSERLFSTSGIILNERRTRLKSSNLEKILFLNKNFP